MYHHLHIISLSPIKLIHSLHSVSYHFIASNWVIIYLQAQLQPKPQHDKFAVSLHATFMYKQQAFCKLGGDMKKKERKPESG